MGRIPFRSPVKISSFRWIPPISNLALSTVFELIWLKGVRICPPTRRVNRYSSRRGPPRALPMKGAHPLHHPQFKSPLVVGANSR